MVASAYQMAEHRKATERITLLEKDENSSENIELKQLKEVTDSYKGLRDMSFGNFDGNLKKQTTKFFTDFGMDITDLDTSDMYQGFEDAADFQNVQSKEMSYVKPADFFAVLKFPLCQRSFPQQSYHFWGLKLYPTTTPPK